MTKTTKRTTRRAVLGVGAGLTSTALLGGLIRPAKAQAGGSTFVLVHGAWRGGWCWRKVADLLTAKDHKVYTPTLTGLGERSHLMSGLINLDTHTNDIVNVVKWEGLENFVLVGHSYGGWPISAAAEHLVPKIASIVFLDAFYPSNGQRGLDLQSEQSRKDVLAAVGRGEVGRTGPSAKAFGNNEANWAWIDAKTTQQPIGVSLQPIGLTGAREKVAKKTYIRAKNYQSAQFDKHIAELKATPGWKTYEVASGHDVMIDAPDRLAEILIDVA